MFYLIDLERTIFIGRTFYWKPGQFGYTTQLEDAGLFSEEKADEIVNSDFDQRTIKIAKLVVEKIFKK